MIFFCNMTAILKFKVWILVKSCNFHNHCLICTIFRYNYVIFSEILLCRYYDVISGGPPSWICDDVTILHPVIDFHGSIIVLYLHVAWFASLRTNATGDTLSVPLRWRNLVLWMWYVLVQQTLALSIYDFTIQTRLPPEVAYYCSLSVSVACLNFCLSVCSLYVMRDRRLCAVYRLCHYGLRSFDGCAINRRRKSVDQRYVVYFEILAIHRFKTAEMTSERDSASSAVGLANTIGYTRHFCLLSIVTISLSRTVSEILALVTFDSPSVLLR